MTMLDDRLRSAAVEVRAYTAELPVPVWAPEAARRRFEIRRRVVAMAAAAAVVLLAIGSVALWLRLTSETPPATTVPPTTTTIATTTTALPPEPTVGAWGRVGADVMQPVVGVFDVAAGPSGLVVAAFNPGENGRQDGVVFVSADGQTWERLGEDDPVLTTGAVLMYGIARNDTAIVAAGMGCENEEEACVAFPRVWWSPDGITWNRSMPEVLETESSGAILDVVATDDGFVAVGSAHQSPSEEEWVQYPAVWFSADGIDWDRVYTGAHVGLAVQRVGVGPDGRVVAVGAVELEEGEEAGHGAIWTSADGRTWERIPDDPAVLGPSEAGGTVRLHAVAAGPQGYLATGSEDGIAPVILRSDDALTWERVESTTLPDVGSLSGVAAIDGGWVVAGPHAFANQREDVPAVWASPDGSEWYRAVNLGEGYVMGMVATDSYLAVAGALSGYDNFHAGVWVGPVPDPADFGAAVDEPVVDRIETMVEAVGNEGSCSDVLEAGFDYAAVLAYWEVRERAADMDADGNGIPCDAEYPALQVERLLGPAEALDVTIEEDMEGTFVASGPAADAGLVCRAGTVDWLGEQEAQHPNAEWRWQARYTCDDGRGDFLIDVEILAHSQQALAEYGYARLGSGTGVYADLQGGAGAVTSWETGATRISGRVWLGEPPRPEPAISISDIDAGASCTDLIAAGYDLVEVVAYAEKYDRPTSLDPDGNGIPCEAVYPASEIEDLFGPADAAAVSLLSDLSTMTFTAEGPAATAGQMCPSGTIEFTNELPPTHPRAELRWRDRYTCEDGSGTFVLDVEEFASDGPDVWQAGRLVEATGDLAGLAGGGSVFTVLGDFDRFTGWLWSTSG